jgi:hypothetical protein
MDLLENNRQILKESLGRILLREPAAYKGRPYSKSGFLGLSACFD